MNYFGPFLFSWLVAIDQITKTESLKYGTIIINKALKLSPEANYGFAFSLFSKFGRLGQLPFITTSLIVVPLIFYIFKDLPKNFATKTAKIFILSGSLSNVADRILRGYVVDFISISTFGLKWSVFNLADCFILAGLLYLNYCEWKTK